MDATRDGEDRALRGLRVSSRAAPSSRVWRSRTTTAASSPKSSSSRRRACSISPTRHSSIARRPPTTNGASCLSAGVRRISELAVGCWAYDTSEIITATPLEQITGRGMFNYQSAFSQSCDAKSEAKTCLLGEDDHLGACYLNQCRELCVDNRDCAPSDNVVGEEIGDAALDARAVATDAPEAGDAEARDGNASPTLDAGASSSVQCKKTDSYIGYCIPSPAAVKR